MATKASTTKPDESAVFLTVEELQTLNEQREHSRALQLAAGVTGEAEPLSDDESALSRVMAELSSSDSAAVIKIYRKRPGTQKLAYCLECSPAEFSLENLRRMYGGGDYNIRIYARDPETNRTHILRNMFETIDDPAPAAMPSPFAAQPVTPAAQPVSGLGEVIELLRAQATRDPMRELQNMLGLMSAMREAMGVGHGNTTAPAQSPLQAIKELLEVQAMVKDLRPGGDAPQSETDKLIDTAREFIPVIRDAIKTPGVPDSAPQLPQPEITNAMPQAKTEFETMIDTLLAYAERGKENFPLYADMVLDEIPESEIESFYSLMESATWFEQLALAMPQVRPHKEWFTKLRAEILRDDEAGDGGAPGEVLTNDAKTGKTPDNGQPANPAKPRAGRVK